MARAGRRSGCSWSRGSSRRRSMSAETPSTWYCSSRSGCSCTSCSRKTLRAHSHGLLANDPPGRLPGPKPRGGLSGTRTAGSTRVLRTTDTLIDLKAVVRPIEQSAGIETLLWNDGEEAVFEAAARGLVDASTPFAVARALVNAGRWPEAIEPLMRLMTGTPTLAARARALLAYIRYYQGNFPLGVSDADAALELARWDGLARAEAHLYASVNLPALNAALRPDEHA